MPVDCTVREHAVETMRRSHNSCKVTETSNSFCLTSGIIVSIRFSGVNLISFVKAFGRK